MFKTIHFLVFSKTIRRNKINFFKNIPKAPSKRTSTLGSDAILEGRVSFLTAAGQIHCQPSHSSETSSFCKSREQREARQFQADFSIMAEHVLVHLFTSRTNVNRCEQEAILSRTKSKMDVRIILNFLKMTIQARKPSSMVNSDTHGIFRHIFAQWKT